jgi:hypothetical protein
VSTDLPDEIGPAAPELADFLALLTSAPTPDELAGESAALAMFRASQPRSAPGLPAIAGLGPTTAAFPVPPVGSSGTPVGSATPVPSGVPVAFGTPVAPGPPVTSGGSVAPGPPAAPGGSVVPGAPLGSGGTVAAGAPAGSGGPPLIPGLDGPPGSSAPVAPLATARRRRWRSPGGLVAAAVVVLIAGLGAAYAAALPAPVQRVAYHVLGFAGVPDAHHHAATPSTGPQPGRTGSGAAGSSHSATTAATSSPHPSASGSAPGHSTHPARRPHPSRSPSAAAPVPTKVAITAASAKVAAGASAVITGQLSGTGGHPAAGLVRLAERPAGQAGWRVVATARAPASGRITLTAPDLTATTVFRLLGPGGLHSVKARVVVIPPVSASVTVRAGRRSAVLTVSCALARPGNLIVLQARSGGGWVSLRTRHLNAQGQARLGIGRHLLGDELRVVLLATVTHGRSVSNTVTTPAAP